jgi:catechol 2,3-dioxygenase-like lactoylglutathione lyase family enzyme
MPVRCKVTFFDNVHEMRRSVEVLAESPARAAEMALARMIERHLLPTDFGPSVTVDVITHRKALVQAIGSGGWPEVPGSPDNADPGRMVWHAVPDKLLPEMPRLERAVPILPTDDLAAAKAFYVDGLGFRVTFEASTNGHSGLLGLERGTIELTLDSPMEGHGRNACTSLLVNDADAYYREWSAKVPVLRAPKDEPWGARTFDLLDPSGNTLFVMGPISA